MRTHPTKEPRYGGEEASRDPQEEDDHARAVENDDQTHHEEARHQGFES